MRLYFVLWESYWQGKGVYPGPCFFVSTFCRRQTDGLQLSTSAAETGGSSEGIKHPTTNWLRQSVPRPSKGGQWGAGSLGWGWKSFVRPSKGVARRLVLQHLSGRLSPCGWGPCGAWWWDAWALRRAVTLSALRRAGDHAEHGGGMLERYAEQRI